MQEQDRHGSALIHPTGNFALTQDEWKWCWLEAGNLKSIAMQNGAEDLTQEELEGLSVVVNPLQKQNVERLKTIVEKIKKTLAKPDSAQQQLLNEVDGLMKLNRYDQVVNKLQRQDDATKKPILCDHTKLMAEAEFIEIDDSHKKLMRRTFKIDGTIFVLSGGSGRFADSLKELQNDIKLKAVFPVGYVRLYDGGGVHWASNYWDGERLHDDTALKGRVEQDGTNCGLFALHEGMLLAKIRRDGKYKQEGKYTQEDIKKDKKDFCNMMVSYHKYNNNRNIAQAGNWIVGTVESYPHLQLTIKKDIEAMEKNMIYQYEDRNFYFSYLNSKGESDAQTAYIDANYHHYKEYREKNNYTLQTTIDKYTETITKGLIAAYNETYGKNTATFDRIQAILQEAQDEEEWKQLRAKHQKNKATEDETNKLKFSAAFQKIMANAGLMTGNPNATNFVGMRLKRVSECHIKKLREFLKPESTVIDNDNPQMRRLLGNIDDKSLSYLPSQESITPKKSPTRDSISGEIVELNTFLDKVIDDKNLLKANDAKCFNNMEVLCTAFDNAETRDKYVSFLKNLHTNLRNTNMTINNSKIYEQCTDDIKQSLALFQLFSPNEPIIQQLTTGWWSYITLDKKIADTAQQAHAEHQKKKINQI